MEKMNIYLASSDDIDKMTKARVDYCLRNNLDIDKNEYQSFYDQVKTWINENVKKNNFVTYFGEINNVIVSFAGVLMYTLPPLFGKDKRKQGHILSFFTYPQYRKMGYGKQLMEYIQKDAKNLEINDLVLKATNEGENLYKKSGFNEPYMKYMEYKIN